MIIPRSAIITVPNWTMAPDGETYMHFYHDGWEIITDDDMSAALDRKFHSSERWHLAARRVSGEIIAIFPGCQIQAFVATHEPPSSKSLKILK